jgi:lipopolysaccharide transport system ATP-binding protein
MTYAIEINNLGKKYILRHEQSERYISLRDVIASRIHKFAQVIRHPLGGYDQGDPGIEEFWALNDLSLQVREGERLGIIGRNGAGKSTLLKVLSRITEPTKGSVRIKGRVASLLEVGTGFHPELTGRENIFLNGAILGMGKKEIARKFDDIVQFAEVERFLDTPVKRYSSGMYVRLAFSVAAHLESDILIVDEVLAVGDAAFQKKCMGKMESVTKEGRTILFVSHNMGAISELCTRAALLNQGALIMEGAVSTVLAEYAKFSTSKHASFIKLSGSCKDEASIISISVFNAIKERANLFDINEEILIEIEYELREEIMGIQVALVLSRNFSDIITTFDTDDEPQISVKPPGKYRAIHKIPAMSLKAGQYRVSVDIGIPDRLIQSIPHAISFDLEELSINASMKGYRFDRPGFVLSPGSWTTKRIDS